MVGRPNLTGRTYARRSEVVGAVGNPHLRRAGSPIEYTPEIIGEYMRCREDALYFIENYVKIKNVDSEDFIPFKLRFYQKAILKSILDNRRTIVKLPRQAGKTSVVAAIMLWHVLFKKNYAILIAAHISDKAQTILAEVKKAYELLPKWLQQGVGKGGWNKKSIQLENESRIRIASTTGTAARGDIYNLIYLDEFAFVADHIADEFFKSVFPTISSGKTTKVVITSTPRGFNAFHKFWEVANEKDVTKWNGFFPIEIRWNQVPGRDETFRNEVIRTHGQEYFDQEYGAEFLGSSSTLISGTKLGVLTWEQPLLEADNMTIFRHVEKGHTYVVTVDTAEGLGGDFSVVMVIDVTQLPYRVVANYRNRNISLMELPQVILMVAKNYNQAHVLVECNFGQQVADILHHDYEYENLVMVAAGERKGQYASSTYGGKYSRFGVKMDKSVKRIGCANLKTMIEKDQLFISDHKILFELQRFVVNGTSYSASDGSHDDLVMSLVLFAWLCDQPYFKEMTDVNVRKAVMERNDQRMADDMLTFHFHDNGSDYTEEEIPKAFAANDDRWLFDFANDPHADIEKMDIIERIQKHFGN